MLSGVRAGVLFLCRLSELRACLRRIHTFGMPRPLVLSNERINIIIRVFLSRKPGSDPSRVVTVVHGIRAMRLVQVGELVAVFWV